MSTTLEPQIRDLSRAFEATIDPVTVDEILGGGIEPATLAPTRTRRPVWVPAVAIASLVLVPLIIIASLWLDEEPAEETTTTTVPDVTTTTILEEATTTTLQASPAVGSEFEADESGLLPALAAGWTWTKMDPSRSPWLSRVRSGEYVRFNPGWTCIQDGAFYTIREDVDNGEPVCSGLVEQPIPTVEISDDGLAWRPTTAPDAPDGWVMHHYRNEAGGYLYVLYADRDG